MVLQMIKRKKYKEMLQTELEGRRMTVSKLGMMYHIHDIIGADLVECIPTTSGPLLRLADDSQRSR
jgi:serine/threonine-protein kinase 19